MYYDAQLKQRAKQTAPVTNVASTSPSTGAAQVTQVTLETNHLGNATETVGTGGQQSQATVSGVHPAGMNSVVTSTAVAAT